MLDETRYPSGRTAGFSVVELLLVVSVLGIVGTLTLQAFYSWLPRLDLRVAAQQSRALITKARLEAIQRGVSTVVEIDPDEGTVSAFADVNGDPLTPASYLIFDPDPALGAKQTDYLIGNVVLESSTLGADGFAAVDGFTLPPAAPPDTLEVLVFSSVGVPESLGAFRLADATGRNVLEIAVASLAGKVESRKYLHADDSPTSSAGFFTQGADGESQNVWTWY